MLIFDIPGTKLTSVSPSPLFVVIYTSKFDPSERVNVEIRLTLMHSYAKCY